MAMSNALFFVVVFVCPLLLRLGYVQGETTAPLNVDVHENFTTVDANSSATTLWPELGTDLSPSPSDTNDAYSTTDENTTTTTTTPFDTDYVTEDPLSFNTTNSTTNDITSSSDSSSDSSDSSSSSSPPPPVNSTSESMQPFADGGGQRFDVASFFGGIILAVGILGLIFFIYKVWQMKHSGYSNI